MDKNLDEMIADARAEEQVAKENAKDNFRNELKKQLREALEIKHNEKVTVSLEEYITLNNKAMDLDRILNAIVSGLKLNYSNDGLRLYDEERVTEAFRALYPEAYDTILALELKHEENGGE